MDAFRRGELFSLRSPGSEEDYEERARLLTDVNALLDDVLDEKAERSERERKYVEDREAASADIMASAMQTIRTTSAESLTDTSTEFTSPSRARQAPTNQILGYLIDKASDAAADREFQQEKLRQKKRKLDLEERKLEMEQAERKHWWRPIRIRPSWSWS
ncbi:TPA: hypothetical protein N0F65_006549 [Lagenidium giganteum]|uniref:Uncharacterized protein n=1 Tax=Lagenidium giganteum TaxID=4803 RepID=A0AAV2YMC9_9STRA|nr:TPA: hypothetical protein N0F65_006549 [Lagenidium giganteum]